MKLVYRFYLNQQLDGQGRLLGLVRGYHQGDRLELVYEGQTDLSPLGYLDTCEYLWHVFNVNPPEDYHNRSMSMGDVIVFVPDETPRRAFTGKSFGFVEIASSAVSGV